MWHSLATSQSACRYITRIISRFFAVSCLLIYDSNDRCQSMVINVIKTKSRSHGVTVFHSWFSPFIDFESDANAGNGSGFCRSRVTWKETCSRNSAVDKWFRNTDLKLRSHVVIFPSLNGEKVGEKYNCTLLESNLFLNTENLIGKNAAHVNH